MGISTGYTDTSLQHGGAVDHDSDDVDNDSEAIDHDKVVVDHEKVSHSSEQYTPTGV